MGNVWNGAQAGDWEFDWGMGSLGRGAGDSGRQFGAEGGPFFLAEKSLINWKNIGDFLS